MSMLEYALKYSQMGMSVIPIRPEKKAYVSWTEFQSRKASNDEIKTWWGKWPSAMIGLVTGQISNLCVIDADSKEAIDQIENLLPENIVVPFSTTPRGGRHYYFKHTDGLINKAGVLDKVDIRTTGGYIITPPSHNNGSGSYKWEVPIDEENLQEMPEVIYKKLYQAAKEKPAEGKITNYLEHGRRDEDMFHLANCLLKGGCDPELAKKALIKVGANLDPVFPAKEVIEKINSAAKRVSVRERNIAAEVREWILSTNGHITNQDCNRDLGLISPEQKKAATMALLRLRDEGVIEKIGDRNGCYRLIPKEENDEMEFVEGDIFEYPVKLPFGLNDIVSLYPQNIIVIAGSKSSGKTSFLLNIAIMNQDRHEVIYLNSEMGPVEWTQRMKQFGYKSKKDIKFKAKKCHRNFHDKIDGKDRIYIIDFMEINDKFWEISARIREIHEKLRDGICFIAIQKKGVEQLGRGAEFSMEKARLYLTLDYQPTFDGCSKLTIMDAKAQKTPTNSKGLYKRIKILSGAAMQGMDKEWLRDS